MIDDKTLQELIVCGIINDVDSVQYLIMSNKLEQIKKIHPYAITPPAKENERWKTSFKDSTTGHRKNVKVHTEDELWKKLVLLYSNHMYLEKLTFHALYEEWLSYKSTITNSVNTIKRHRQHYVKYFATSVLDEMKIKKIDELLLEKECNRIVKEFNLSRKEWTNVKTVLNRMFEYAVRKKKYLEINPLENVKISVRYRQIIKKTGKTETYNTEELQHLNQYLDRMYSETSCICT